MIINPELDTLGYILVNCGYFLSISLWLFVLIYNIHIFGQLCPRTRFAGLHLFSFLQLYSFMALQCYGITALQYYGLQLYGCTALHNLYSTYVSANISPNHNMFQKSPWFLFKAIITFYSFTLLNAIMQSIKKTVF